MKKTLTLFFALVTMLCLLTGCRLFTPRHRLLSIKGDIECRFHVTENAKYDKPVDFTDVPFDKDKFVKLYNEDRSYDPDYMTHHLDKCDLKLDPVTELEEWKKIDSSEVMITAVTQDGNESVSVFKYNSKWYFFVLDMGGRSKPEVRGTYYKELSKEMAEYWSPILDKVLMTEGS